MKQQSVRRKTLSYNVTAGLTTALLQSEQKKQMRYEVAMVVLQRDFWQTFFTIMLRPSSKRVWAFSHSIFSRADQTPL